MRLALDLEAWIRVEGACLPSEMRAWDLVHAVRSGHSGRMILTNANRSLHRVVLTGATLALAACGGADDPDADPEPSPTAPTAPSSTTSDPDPDETATVTTGDRVALTSDMTWQWQLQGEIETSHDADVYDIDLFDAPDETIDRLHDDGRVVICYFSTAYEDWRDDAASWPTDALGEPLDDWEGERWVDIRDEGARAVLVARLDLAAERGCDGVEPDNVTAYDNDSGFDLTVADQLDFNRALASAAHERGLLIGLKNGLEQIPELVDDFDFAVNEQCVEYDECDVYAAFVAAGKPIFGAEYSDDAVSDPERACSVAEAAGISALILPVDLDGSFRIAC